ncbi:hypothetical protein LAS9624_01540 [Latilactobacillus sakei]|nr:hypothetical protein LAS9624_01540 [Latilactobacillus sakei]
MKMGTKNSLAKLWTVSSERYSLDIGYFCTLSFYQTLNYKQSTLNYEGIFNYG